MTNGIAVDVTSLIGAEDYLTSQNRRTHPQDPFARQCFVEVIQTLLFIEDVFVAHPVRGDPQPEDFGLQPHLLQELIGTGLLHPLQLDPAQWSLARASEADAISDLKDPLGTRSVVQFIDQALACDSSRPGGEFSLSARLRRWSDFHRREVRVAGHHQARSTLAMESRRTASAPGPAPLQWCWKVLWRQWHRAAKGAISWRLSLGA